jgi:hypothetical protein
MGKPREKMVALVPLEAAEWAEGQPETVVQVDFGNGCAVPCGVVVVEAPEGWTMPANSLGGVVYPDGTAADMVRASAPGIVMRPGYTMIVKRQDDDAAPMAAVRKLMEGQS